MALHGSIVKYEGPASLKAVIGGRDKFLNPDLVASVNAAIKAREPLRFLPITYKEYNEKFEYRIILVGILEDGRKTGVIITGIRHYFTVRAPSAPNLDEWRTEMKTFGNTYKGTVCEFIQAKGFDCYEQELHEYAKFTFDSSKSRERALEYARDKREWQTACDEVKHMGRTASRIHGFNLCHWNMLNYWTQVDDPMCKVFCLKVGVEDIKPLPEQETHQLQHLQHNYSMVKTWDIETYTGSGSEFPDAELKEDVIFNIANTFHWQTAVEPFLAIVLTTRPSTPDPDFLTIMCSDEKSLIIASAVVHSLMMPDYVIGFNDGGFDWPFVLTKAKQYGIVLKLRDYYSILQEWEHGTLADQEADFLKWRCRKREVKLEAQLAAGFVGINMPGYVNIDVSIVFRKLFPREQKKTLNAFLRRMQLQLKDDMPYQEMFKIYRRSLDDSAEAAADMARVMHYCMKDAALCQALMLKQSVISNYREMGRKVHQSLDDTVYFADGIKVRCRTYEECLKRNIMPSVQVKASGGEKFTGAYVFHPKTGMIRPKASFAERRERDPRWHSVTMLELAELQNAFFEGREPIAMGEDARALWREFVAEPNKYPVTPVDFSSLYPSIAIAFNLSPEMLIRDERQAELLREVGVRLHDIDFIYSGVRIRAWVVDHGTIDGVELKPGFDEAKMGVYPTILKEGFDARMYTKAQAKKYREGEFMHQYYNGKQQAEKILLNTFYGELGNANSPSRVIELAGFITNRGQYFIKEMFKFVTSTPLLITPLEQKENGFSDLAEVMYGDTDSLYVMCAPANYADLDRLYYGGRIPKEEYFRRVVERAQEAILVVERTVNARLYQMTGTTFLKMVAEKTLFPCMFIQRKMYAGVEHDKGHIVAVPKFGDLLLKGLSFTKRGASIFMEQVCRELFVEIFNPAQSDDLLAVVENKLRQIYARQWALGDFRKTAVYKPSKQNKAVLTFYERMVQRADPTCPPPTPSDRFEYIIADMFPFKYDVRGRKVRLAVGDQYEYLHYAETHGLTASLAYYVEHELIGQFSSLLSSHARFRQAPAGLADAAVEAAHGASVRIAEKHLAGFCARLGTQAVCQGVAMKKIWKSAQTQVNSVIGRVCPPHMKKFITYEFDSARLFDSIRELAEQEAAKKSDEYAAAVVAFLVRRWGRSFIYVAKRIYKTSKAGATLLALREKRAQDETIGARRLFAERTAEFMRVFKSRDNMLEYLVQRMREAEGLTDDRLPSLKEPVQLGGSAPQLDPDAVATFEAQQETMRLLFELYTRLRVIHSIRINTESIIKQIDEEIKRDVGVETVPKGLDIPAVKNELIARMKDLSFL
jgi:DNA polymerase elongation subunit (family B)